MSPTDDCKDGLTTNPNHADLGHGADDKPVPQNKCYLVLNEEERAKGFVRPYRDSYIHDKGCGARTMMGQALAETYARNPHFYGATYCCGCSMHRPVGADGEFVWDGTDERVANASRIGSARIFLKCKSLCARRFMAGSRMPTRTRSAST